MAAYTPNIAPSTILRSKATTKDENEPRRQTKQEFKKQKELEEGRKAGTVPAMTDYETGRDINPHIPHYISNSPWYLNSSGPTLKHQKPHPERQIDFAAIYEVSRKGVTNKLATKFRQGACENCGAMTHKKKDCFERPRKIGAKYTNEDIAPDEYLPEDLTLTYDSKRDRWSGFNPSDHAKVIDEFQRLEEARKIIKTAELLEKDETEDVATTTTSTTTVVDVDDKKVSESQEETSADLPKEVDHEEDEYKADIDEDKYAEGADMPGVKVDVDSHTKITVRNLRIREDTAKYLYNLDPESAFYDPKSRAMREDPFKNLPAEKRPQTVPFKGDNFQRYTGEVRDADRSQMFAWEANTKGLDVHALAEPTKLEALRKEYDSKKNTIKTTIQESIFDKYGGKEHVLLDDETKKLIYQAQTDSYTEYNRKGELVKGQEKPIIRSRYIEDRHLNNHTSIFGTYWSQGRWGYKCCHGFIKNSYCLGEAGKSTTNEEEQKKYISPAKMNDEPKKESVEQSDQSEQSSESDSSDGNGSDVDSPTEQKPTNQKRMDRKRRRRMKRRERNKKLKKSEKDQSSSSGSESDSESSQSDDDTKRQSKNDDELMKSLIRQAEKDKLGRIRRDMDDRNRPYNSMAEEKPLSQVDLEAYKLTKLHPDDPMASYFDK